MLSLDRLAQLVNKELHAIDFLQQVVREFNVGLVDFIDQQHDTFFGFECVPELAPLDVIEATYWTRAWSAKRIG